MSHDLRELADRFRRQADFAADYSNLYAHLFGTLADWLEAHGAKDDPLIQWLLKSGRVRDTLDVTLLLAAGLHRDVLAQNVDIYLGSAIDDLAQYFPTVGGLKAPGDRAFAAVLRQAIMARQGTLSDFIRNGNVQTNETGRGLCWLLPLLATGWKAIHLVDLGASAGLNLAADRRAYRLVTAQSDNVLLDLGEGRPVQFVTRCQGDILGLRHFQGKMLPAIITRTGCDLSPVPLGSESDELNLESFIWGDQVERMARLREGIEAFHQLATSEGKVTVHPAELPDELGPFLRNHVPAGRRDPVVLYNTYMRNFLKDEGRSLGSRIDKWAAGQERPVAWIQWEMARHGAQPPTYSWGAWTVDLWDSRGRGQWQLGWTHPHGAEVEFGPGLSKWVDFWRN